ncbi:MAG: insulinase family protein [Microcoleus sp. PH2017_04_SCI_O_A]|nr:insulinase family protein [Microcoleus sp. PH2017_04_SCI_O_A]
MKRTRLRLKKVKLFLLALCFFTVSLGTFNLLPSLAAGPKHYDELKFPGLAEIKLPKYTRFELKNGIRVYLMEDRELPLVGGTALFRTGDRFEPADKIGLGGLTGEVMRTGGTETGIDVASGNANFSALAEDVEPVFDLFSEVIREPIFAKEKLDLAKNQEQGGIARRNDDPNDITGREFQKLIYGDRSPYARTAEYKTIANISRDDLVGFYQKYFHPKNMILGISGDFDTAKMRSLVEQKFGNWVPTKSAEMPALPAVTPANQGGIFLVNQPQLSQSYVQMGHLGGMLNSPDYGALDVMNGVMNGFGGRLFNNVRSRQGLAYSVYAAWSPRFDYPGTFVAGGQTRSDATVPFIKAIRAEIDRIRTEPITAEELAFAKDSTLNSFIFKFENPSQTLSRLMRYEYYGYPEDFIFRYRRSVEAATIADVQRVAKTYLKPENLVTLVVGNTAGIQPPLSSLGTSVKVQSVDITIPSAT